MRLSVDLDVLARIDSAVCDGDDVGRGSGARLDAHEL
jgi:hypothetical protein